jgi:hypothetical protein
MSGPREPARVIPAGRSVAAVLMVLLALAGATIVGQPRNPHAVALAEFQERVKTYVALRDKATASITPPKPTANPQDIASRQQALAEGVRRARADAKPGDVFSAPVVPILKAAVLHDFRQRTPRQRAAALKEVPSGLSLKVNDTYPKSTPLATVPPKLLAEMPRLPDGLEYRFVGRRLILHDTMTNLVVDILPDAVPGK